MILFQVTIKIDITVGVPNIIDTDILLRPVEVDMKELGADPMSGEHREEAQSVQVDPNGIHSRLGFKLAQMYISCCYGDA